MAATVIDSYADELESYVNDGALMDTNLSFARTFAIPFVVTLAGQAPGEDIALAIIPKGARILSGTISASATLSNSAQISIGLAAKDGSGYLDAADSVSDSTTYLKAAATQGTTQVGFALTQALGYLYEAEKDLYLTCTTSVGTVGTEVLKGHVLVAYP